MFTDKKNSEIQRDLDIVFHQAHDTGNNEKKLNSELDEKMTQAN